MKTTTTALVIVVLVACGAAPDPTTDTSTTVPTTPTPTTDTTPPGQDPIDPVAVEARLDLAERLGVAPDHISVVSVEKGVWNDGSIGCPEPGMAYTQALVAGTRVALEHAATTYWYHQGGSVGPFLCERPAAGSFSEQHGTS
jgi:hypothetical protein